LAVNIAKKNETISQKNLNFSVQATIDRILFLRICEDRAIEPYGKLKQKAEGTGIYNGLGYLFQEADQRYNSGLFHFKEERGRNEPPDNITMNLNIDDNLLRDLILNLYYPNSPYIFSKIPVEILGQVYEQFLGKVIQLDENHIAEVEDKPEVKKAGGVKYTPAYIVQYIVNGTLGPLLKSKNHPNEVALIYVLDPACGSGSFLLVAYQYLLDWHLDWYIKNLAPILDKGAPITSITVKKLMAIPIEDQDNGESQKIKVGAGSRRIKARAEARAVAASVPIYKTPDGKWHLTIAERKRILLNNIYGVDIDRQAVEVTKLSLLLKVLEGENQQTVSDLLKFLHERALPDLGDNIKCGNSLIDYDIMKTAAWQKLSEAEQDRINPFDWDTEFHEIMQAGGFHAIIGNPPYIRIQVMKEWAPLEVEHYKGKYASASKGNYDIYVVFVEKGISLLNEHGRLGFILPHKFFNANYGQPLRTLISNGKYLSEIVHFGDLQVFEGVTTYTCLLFLNKSGTDTFRLVKPKDLDIWQFMGEADEGYVPADKANSMEWNFSVGNESTIFEKLAAVTVHLEDIAERISQGIRTSANEVYVLDLVSINNGVICAKSEILNEIVEIERDSVLWFLQGREIRRYVIQPSGKLVVMPYSIVSNKAMLNSEIELSKRFPKTYEYLCRNKDYLNARENGRFKGAGWYMYGRSQNIDLMSLPKILVPDIASHVSFMLDQTGNYAFTSGYGITLKKDLPESEKFILGLLNSKLSDFYLKRMSTQMRGGFYKYETRFIRNLPIYTIDFSNVADKASHDRIVSLVDQMLTLHKQLTEVHAPQENITIQRRIEATDEQIDTLVYDLYGLTEEEIKIVEAQ